MNKGVQMALVTCGSCLVALIPLRSILIDRAVMHALKAGGEPALVKSALAG